MISRQGSHWYMLRDDAVFDISFKQLGQADSWRFSKFVCGNIQGRANGSHARQKNTNRPALIWGTASNGDPVTASGFPIRKDRTGNRRLTGSSPAGAAHT
ncbi:MAG: hypothetical protein ACRED3_15435, partial [Bradyrhizobium sp.]